MTTTVEKTILVNVPISTAYNQWTQFEDFPQFMGGVKSVTQLSDDRLEWVAEIAGVRRQWQAESSSRFPIGKLPGRRRKVRPTLAPSRSPMPVVARLPCTCRWSTSLRAWSKVGDKLNIVENQAERDLERFKAFIESEGYASGAWRGSVNEGAQAGTPGVEEAAQSRGDSGKAGGPRPLPPEWGCCCRRRRRRGRQEGRGKEDESVTEDTIAVDTSAGVPAPEARAWGWAMTTFQRERCGRRLRPDDGHDDHAIDLRRHQRSDHRWARLRQHDRHHHVR